MIYLWRQWKTGSLIVCGSFWPGAKDGAPMPQGWPDCWRPDQIEAAERASRLPARPIEETP